MSVQTNKEIFLNYVQAFEDACASNDWALLGACFARDIVHDTGFGNDIVGRENVVSYLADSVENFDHRFDSRSPSFDEISVSGNQVSARWRFVYSKAGTEDLVTSGVEIAEIAGGEITRLASLFDSGTAEHVEAWMEKYGHLL